MNSFFSNSVTDSVGSDMAACNPHQSTFQNIQCLFTNTCMLLMQMTKKPTTAAWEGNKTSLESNRTYYFMFQQFIWPLYTERKYRFNFIQQRTLLYLDNLLRCKKIESEYRLHFFNQISCFSCQELYLMINIKLTLA